MAVPGDGDRPGQSSGGGLGHGRPHASQPGLRRLANGSRRPSTSTGIDFSLRQGQYTSDEFAKLLEGHKITQSFSRPRQCWTTRWPKAGSLRSKKIASTAAPGQAAPKPAARSSTTSRSSTTASGSTPRWAISPPSSTNRSTNKPRLRPHNQPVRRTGSIPMQTLRGLCAGGVQATRVIVPSDADWVGAAESGS